MMTEFTGIYTALILGLLSMTHCVLMCGTVIGALTLSLPAEVRESKRKMWPFVLSYNIGRLVSYGIAGAIVGGLSSPLEAIGGHQILRYLSFFIMIGMGLYLAGWLPKFAHIERIGAPIWRHLQPFAKRFMPVRTRRQAFGFGMVWGWLPCGLVYAGLLVAATAGSASHGAITMMAFGVGTLPAVLGAGIFTGLVVAMGKAKHARKIAGLLIIAMAIITISWPMADMAHAMHDTPAEHTSHTHAH